ncbi:hypothetical protein DMC47_11230 [Nostoc sp. 3335mG]|nr:hypothetical protein DMC47_11230 [Nostoc sp. 3335mG]
MEGLSMRDPLFGHIEYDFGWRGQCTWPLFGRLVTTMMVIACDEGEEISLVQREAFIGFQRHQAVMCRRAEGAIFEYYLEALPDLRSRFGPQFADLWAPEISRAEDMVRLITPAEVIIQEPFIDPAERIVGLLFDCTWEQSLGLGVKFVYENLAEVGTQDILL